MNKSLSLTSLALAIATLFTLQTPAYAQGIQYVEYHKNSIPNITTAAGIATEIIFEEDEKIEYASFGFEDAWESQTVRDHIFVFKAKDAEPQTNLIVHTDKRDYVFTVTTGNNDWTKTRNTSGAVYSLRIVYRDSKSKSAQDAKKAAEEMEELRNRDISPKSTYVNKNYDYRATENAKTLIPHRVWDNGTLTFIAFEPGTKRGVVFELDENNKASLVNQHTEKNGLLIIHGVYPKLIVRLGDQAVEIRRNDLRAYLENNSKTTITGTERTIDGDAPTEFKTQEPPQQPPLNGLIPTVPSTQTANAAGSRSGGNRYGQQ